MGARVLILIVALAACKRQSEKWCEMHSGDLEHCGFLLDARPVCTSEADCASSPNAPYCEVAAGICVECIMSEHCAANEIEKYCDLETYRCTSCVTDANCASGLCLPNGVCGDDSNIAYVDPDLGVDNPTCGALLKCKTIKAALATKKPNIKLQGAIKEAVVVDMQRTVTFVAEPGTTLTRPMMGVIMDITGGSDVSIYDLTIIGFGEKGIVADMSSTLHLTRVTVTGCNTHDKRAVEVKHATLFMSRSTIASNIGGGILADANATYVITNSFIYRNGLGDSAVGGASLAPTSAAFNRFEMNTVVDNVAKTVAGGVECASTVAAPNNIVARNLTGAANTLATQTAGPCNFSQSLLATDLEQLLFVMPDGTGPWDYHLTAGSIAIDRGVMSNVNVDYDGDMRPQSTTGVPRFDVGADEYKP